MNYKEFLFNVDRTAMLLNRQLWARKWKFGLVVGLMVSFVAFEVNAQAVITDPSTSNPNYEVEKQRLASRAAARSASARLNNLGNMQLLATPADASAMVSNSNECFIPRDNSYTAIPVNDDGSYGPIDLPFTYDLYGSEYNQVWINTNGNITFTGPIAEYSSTGFPFETPMVAAFWGDVDTREGGQIYFKLSNQSLIVTYENVGYYGAEDDTKANTFQLIITDGTDPLIGIGQNTAFYYKDMQWTTGTASSGVGGFGGTPATVGINKGNNAEYIQVGRFDANSSAYDGPGGSFDGVNYLDDKCFDFNVGDADNIPPSVSNLPANNTISLLVGESISIAPEFIGPEVGQDVVTTVSTTMCDVTQSVTNGAVSTANITIVGSMCNVGTNTIVLEATDNGVPVRSIRETITVEVVNPCSVSVATRDVVVQLDENGEATIAAEDVNNNSTANCGIASVAVAPNVFNCSNLGQNTVILTVTDSMGTVGTATAMVTVEDGAVPTIAAPADITVLNSPGECGAASVALGNAITADNCTVASVSNNAPEVFPVGNTTVTWMVMDASGNSASATQIVTVNNDMPEITDIIIPIAPRNINSVITANASYNDNNLSSASWNWGDGADSDGNIGASAVTGTHIYTSPGTYTISLTVTDACGETDVYEIQGFEVLDPGSGTVIAPVADAGDDQQLMDSDADGEAVVTLDGSGSMDADGSIVSYSWSVAGTEIATGINPTVVLPLGSTTVTLTVTDDDGAADTDEVVIMINEPANTAPVADAGDDQQLMDSDADGEETVSLAGSGSMDADGNIVSYSWSVAGTEIATGINPTVVLPVGSTTVTLTVIDNDGAADTDEVTIAINATQGGNLPPVVSAGADKMITLPYPSFRLSGTGYDPDGRFRAFQWEQVSGPGVTINGARTANAMLTDLEEGTYVFRFSATDNEGATSSDEMTLTVQAVGTPVNLQPRIISLSDKTVVLPNNTAFFIAIATDPDGTIDSYEWEKVSGPEVTMERADSPTLSLSGLEEGDYIFEVRITDNQGAQVTRQVRLSVVEELLGNQAPVVMAGRDRTIRLPQSNVTLSGTGYDPDGRFTAFFWEKVSGPEVTMNGARTANANLSDLEEGTYVFRFSATDNEGVTFSDELTLIVEGDGALNAVAVSAWPNTFDNYIDLKIEAEEADQYEVKVWDLKGALIYKGTYQDGPAGANPYRIEFMDAHMEQGVYLLQLEGQKNHFNKVIKMVKR